MCYQNKYHGEDAQLTVATKHATARCVETGEAGITLQLLSG